MTSRLWKHFFRQMFLREQVSQHLHLYVTLVESIFLFRSLSKICTHREHLNQQFQVLLATRALLWSGQRSLWKRHQRGEKRWDLYGVLWYGDTQRSSSRCSSEESLGHCRATSKENQQEVHVVWWKLTLMQEWTGQNDIRFTPGAVLEIFHKPGNLKNLWTVATKTWVEVQWLSAGLSWGPSDVLLMFSPSPPSSTSMCPLPAPGWTLTDSMICSQLQAVSLSLSLSLPPSGFVHSNLKPRNLFTAGLALLYVSNLTAASSDSPVWKRCDKADMGF